MWEGGSYSFNDELSDVLRLAFYPIQRAGWSCMLPACITIISLDALILRYQWAGARSQPNLFDSSPRLPVGRRPVLQLPGAVIVTIHN
jgi:hypothetical protein